MLNELIFSAFLYFKDVGYKGPCLFTSCISISKLNWVVFFCSSKLFLHFCKEAFEKKYKPFIKRSCKLTNFFFMTEMCVL